MKIPVRPVGLLMTTLASSLLLSSCAIAQPPEATTHSPLFTPSVATPGAPSTLPVPTALPSASQVPLEPGPKLDTGRLQRDLDEWRAKMEIPGAIVTVWTASDAWTAESGSACPDGSPLTPDAHMRIGSVTKTMTATAVLVLADQGRVGLDDPIETYLPGLPNPQATLRQVMEMKSGIANYTDLESFDKAVENDPARAWTIADLLEVIRQAGSYYAPGDGYTYSNSNSVILGAVVEKVTGQPFGTAMEDLVLAPAGLPRTTYPSTPAIPAPSTCGMSNLGDFDRAPQDTAGWSPSSLGPAGAVISTVDDMRRWAQLLATTDPLLKPETQKARLDSLAEYKDGYGYGLGLNTDRGYIGHEGEMDGFTSVVRYNPARGIGIVVLVPSNVYFENWRPARVLFDVLEGDLR